MNDSEYGPVGCSVDPTTGNLAVTNETKIQGTSGPGNVALYTRASGKPTFYFDPSIAEFGGCAYDNKGNLYALGSDSSSVNVFAELLKGQNELTLLELNETITDGWNMQWDGKYLAVVAGSPGSLIYRFKAKGGIGKAVGVLKLKGTSWIAGFTVQGGSLYAALVTQSEVAIYPYPRGGKAHKSFLGFNEGGGGSSYAEARATDVHFGPGSKRLHAGGLVVLAW